MRRLDSGINHKYGGYHASDFRVTAPCLCHLLMIYQRTNRVLTMSISGMAAVKDALAPGDLQPLYRLNSAVLGWLLGWATSRLDTGYVLKAVPRVEAQGRCRFPEMV